jgi:hypothetical protein
MRLNTTMMGVAERIRRESLRPVKSPSVTTNQAQALKRKSPKG